MSSSRVTGPAVLAALSLLMCARPATAQDRVFVGSREVGAIGHFGGDLGQAPALLWEPRFGGERYVHVFGRGVIDLRTGRAIPLAEGFPVAYDRARPRVYMGRSDGIWAVDVSTSWSFLVLPVSVTGLATCVHATSADVLFCAFLRPDGQHDIVRSGPFGPVLVVTTRFAEFPSSAGWVVTPDASRIYLKPCARSAGSTPPYHCVEPDLAMVDVATGAVSTAGRFDARASLRLVWDDVHDRLFAVGTRIDVFTSDLVSLGSAATGGRCRDLAISPHSGRIYLNVYDDHFSTSWATLSAYDAGALRPLEPGIMRTAHAACGIAVVTAPGAPRDLQAHVIGRDLALTWTNIGAASGFVLDVGFAPGRTDWSLFLGPEAFARFSGVPPGTYYVRLRGGNEVGGGRSSDEMVVRVR